MKNREWVRGMTDEELADFLLGFADCDDRLHYCRDLPECHEDLNAFRDIPPPSAAGAA